MSALQLQTDIIVAYILLTSLNTGGSQTTAEKSFFFSSKSRQILPSSICWPSWYCSQAFANVWIMLALLCLGCKWTILLKGRDKDHQKGHLTSEHSWECCWPTEEGLQERLETDWWSTTENDPKEWVPQWQGPRLRFLAWTCGGGRSKALAHLQKLPWEMEVLSHGKSWITALSRRLHRGHDVKKKIIIINKP